jgi:PLD-like domain
MSAKAFEELLTPELNLVVKGFHHKGEWAIHEALTVLLSRTGPASVMMETFNVSEDALRPMFFEVEAGHITDLRLVLDMNVKRHKLEMLLFAAGITPDIRLASCHAKILLIRNERYRIGIVGSANANQPIRYEAGFIFTDPGLFALFEETFNRVFNDDSIPFEWNSQ